jgi:hypothetical protein
VPVDAPQGRIRLPASLAPGSRRKSEEERKNF